MKLEMIGHSLARELNELIRLFEDQSPMDPDHFSTLTLVSEVVSRGDQIVNLARIIEKEEVKAMSQLEFTPRAYFHGDKAFKWEIRRSAYIALSNYFESTLNWGILTGIRPSKIVQELLMEIPDISQVLKIIKDFYFVSDSKANLVLDIAQRELKILSLSKKESISIYIGIPFCTTRCLYCSFTSNSVKKYEKIIPQYIDCLKTEIKAVSAMVAEKNYRVESIYIGGGTPTSISAEQLGNILDCIEDSFDLSSLLEYTLEAGRPDSITMEKLSTIKRAGVSRISINPQSMNPDVLKLIGRSHKAEDIVHAFKLARDMGFSNINMDVIAGLPGDHLESFRHTMDQLIHLNPENITVHTFSVKRASLYNKEKEKYSLPKNPEEMVQAAFDMTQAAGFFPYYMYRQRNILGNLENVGYSKPGFENLYNIQIMGEKQTIIAIRAGAISKVYYPLENRLERIFNVKSVEDYISRTQEMIVRKESMPW